MQQKYLIQIHKLKNCNKISDICIRKEIQDKKDETLKYKNK